MLTEDELSLVAGGCDDCKKIIIEQPLATPTPAIGYYQPICELLPSPGWPEPVYIT